jgi:hypothetical protein
MDKYVITLCVRVRTQPHVSLEWQLALLQSCSLPLSAHTMNTTHMPNSMQAVHTHAGATRLHVDSKISFQMPMHRWGRSNTHLLGLCRYVTGGNSCAFAGLVSWKVIYLVSSLLLYFFFSSVFPYHIFISIPSLFLIPSVYLSMILSFSFSFFVPFLIIKILFFDLCLLCVVHTVC